MKEEDFLKPEVQAIFKKHREEQELLKKNKQKESEDKEKVSNYIFFEIKGKGIVKVEYIKHSRTEEQEGVLHSFYFRSQVRDLQNNIAKQRYSPIQTNQEDAEIKEWFRKIIRSKLGEDAKISEKRPDLGWKSDLVRKRRNYFTYSCFVSKSN